MQARFFPKAIDFDAEERQATFFLKALHAAEKGPSAFSAELKKWNEDTFKYIYNCEELITYIIRLCPDKNLYEILKVLVDEHNVNLENRDPFRPLLAVAANHAKKNAVLFLLERKMNVNDPRESALAASLCSTSRNPAYLRRRAIAKLLIKNNADINFQSNLHGVSPLMCAVGLGDPKIVKFLLSKNADISLIYHWGKNDEFIETALSMAYKSYKERKKIYGDDDPRTINYSKSLDILLKHVWEKCYELAFSETKDSPTIDNYLKKLSGNWVCLYLEEINSTSLLTELKTIIQDPLIKQIRDEQRHAFLMSSRFYEKDGDLNLTRLIFSYVHDEENPQETTSSEMKLGPKRR